jgi:hypothetical protein
MIINKKWEMPNANTFSIKCINELIYKYFDDKYLSIDPFANINKIAKFTNDLCKEYKTTHNLDALEFLKLFNDASVDFVLYDPPYSPRQVSEVYKKHGFSVNMQTTQSIFWTKIKHEISRIVKPNGICISFGWNSNGIGKKLNFTALEILLVAHGGIHNDTICTVEKKNNTLF